MTIDSYADSRLSREDYPPAAVDVRVKRYAPHVRFAREVRDLVPDLKRPRPGTHQPIQFTATIVARFIRHRRKCNALQGELGGQTTEVVTAVCWVLGLACGHVNRQTVDFFYKTRLTGCENLTVSPLWY